ncbi:hypothetical protein RJT34_21559 [Clitoria ternatea]|uniref:Uncharacterized protein n=1 Tax=Clitoria ternatea TaxID=43366 RepID=A0AAN9IV49_CLITE
MHHKDNANDLVPSLLLSLSSDNGYRNNSVSRAGGTFLFDNLFPGMFYLRLVLKLGLFWLSLVPLGSVEELLATYDSQCKELLPPVIVWGWGTVDIEASKPISIVDSRRCSSGRRKKDKGKHVAVPKALGHTDIEVKILETGWPSKGDLDEDLKPGLVSERNYDLYYPNGNPDYNIGLQGYLPEMVIESKLLV